MRKYAMLCIASMALAGCISAGTAVDPEKVSTFRDGATTEGQVLAALGRPNGTANLPGKHVWTYTYTTTRVNAATFVPIVGLLAGGATGKATTATFTFNSAGTLVDHSTTTTDIDVNTGLLQ